MNTGSQRRRAPFVLVVGAGFTPTSDYALDEAAQIAGRIPGSELHVVRAIATTVPASRVEHIANRLEAYMTEVTAAVGAPLAHFAVHVRAGRASLVIAEIAAEVHADLIMLGAREAGLTKLFRGSVVKRTLAIAPCPVVVAGPRPRNGGVQSTTMEPACKACVRVRAETHGAEWWCSQHSDHHVRAHAYRYRRELPLRQHDSAIAPTGIDMRDGRA